MGNALGLYVVCVGSAWGLYGTPMGSAWDSCGICMGFVLGLCGIVCLSTWVAQKCMWGLKGPGAGKAPGLLLSGVLWTPHQGGCSALWLFLHCCFLSSMGWQVRFQRQRLQKEWIWLGMAAPTYNLCVASHCPIVFGLPCASLKHVMLQPQKPKCHCLLRNGPSCQGKAKVLLDFCCRGHCLGLIGMRAAMELPYGGHSQGHPWDLFCNPLGS